jgi:hypothetical protein
MTYRVAFDIAEAGYKSWSFPAFGLIFVVVGAVLVTFRKNLPGAPGKAHPRASAAFAWFFLGFAVLWTTIAFVTTYSDYRTAASAARTGRVGVVEGRVVNFKPMPASGHAMERFCVQDQCFEYSDFMITAGFNNTSSHGGPIKKISPSGLPTWGTPSRSWRSHSAMTASRGCT